MYGVLQVLFLGLLKFRKYRFYLVEDEQKKESRLYSASLK